MAVAKRSILMDACRSRSVPGRILVGWLVAIAAIHSAPRFSVADVITLKSGGAVRGKIVAHSPTDLAVRTQTDGLIVVERDAIKQIDLTSSVAAPRRFPRENRRVRPTPVGGDRRPQSKHGWDAFAPCQSSVQR